MGDGRRKEKEVRGAGSGSKMFSRVEGYAVYSLYNLRLYSLYNLRLYSIYNLSLYSLHSFR